MGILKIDENTEFVDLIRDHADIEITGGKYFLGKFKERSKLIEEILNIPMPATVVGCEFDIKDRIEQVMGYRPNGHYHFISTDQETKRKVWSFNYQMPHEVNISPSKHFHIRLLFK